jgi:Uma2 family endonuclease
MKTIPAKPLSTAADLFQLVKSLGVPAKRVLLDPQPGRATEKDLLRSKCPTELIDGALVETAMGWYESWLGMVLSYHLQDYNRKHQAGIIIGEQGLMRVAPGQVRIADVAFYSWDRFPSRKLPQGQILDQVPDLAVEIMSPGNTEREMERKRREYFAGGTTLVWEVDPRKRQVAVYTAPDAVTILDENGTLDGGAVLPGFTLSIREWFAEAGERA